MPIDGVIAIIGESGTDYQPLLDREVQDIQKPAPTSPTPGPVATSPTSSAQNAQQITPATSGNDTKRVKISPLARKLAGQKGYDIATIEGTGENGRIVKRDIEAHERQQEKLQATVQQVPAVVEKESFTEEPVSQMRKTIAKRLSESKLRHRIFISLWKSIWIKPLQPEEA